MKRAVLLTITLWIAIVAQGQVVDSTSINGRGLMLTVSGKGMILTGAAYILAGIMAQL